MCWKLEKFTELWNSLGVEDCQLESVGKGVLAVCVLAMVISLFWQFIVFSDLFFFSLSLPIFR
jgi:hypothetical protein